MKAVMYHYVREYDSSLPHFRYLDVDNFRRQLDFFAKEYGFVTKSEFENFIQFGKMPDIAGKVLLTFDDAMSCHYDYVFPELYKRGLWGIFYVPTIPYRKGKILDVHRIHLLCGAIEGKILLKNILGKINKDMVPDSNVLEFRSKIYRKQENYEGVTEFKRILNYFIDYEYRTKVIDQVATDLGYKFDLARFYVSKSSLKEMLREEMVIGSHTNSHPVMSELSREDQMKELELSFSFLSELIEKNNKTYSHPYGGFNSFNEDTINLLNEINVDYSFNVESREINSEDWLKSKQHLPRFDCNLFPHGDTS